MTAQLSRERRDIIEQTANHIISREDTSEHSENLKAVAELALLALAGMESEPVAYFYPGDETEWQGVALAEELDDEQKARCIPLYTAPPAPVAVPDELTREEYKRRFMEKDDFDDTYRGGWNACRAAMLKAGPVTAATVPDGWKLVPVEPTKEMIDAGWSYYMTTKSPSSLGVYGAMLAAAPEQEV